MNKKPTKTTTTTAKEPIHTNLDVPVTAPEGINKVELAKELALPGTSDSALITNLDILISDLQLPEQKGKTVDLDIANIVRLKRQEYFQEVAQQKLPPTNETNTVTNLEQEQETKDTSVSAEETFDLLEALEILTNRLGFQPELAEFRACIQKRKLSNLTEQDLISIQLEFQLKKMQSELTQIKNSLHGGAEALAVKTGSQIGNNRALALYIADLTSEANTLEILYTADLTYRAKHLKSLIEANPLQRIAQNLNIPLPEVALKESQQKILTFLQEAQQTVDLTKTAIALGAARSAIAQAA